MAEEVVAIHVRAASEFLEAAEKILRSGEPFAAVSLATISAERAAIAIVLHLGGRPAIKHRHHEVMRALRGVVGEALQGRYDRVMRYVAELMGNLTAVRYRYEVGGELVSPRQMFGEVEARDVLEKAKTVLSFARELTRT